MLKVTTYPVDSSNVIKSTKIKKTTDEHRQLVIGTFYELLAKFFVLRNVRLLQYPLCVTSTADIKTSVHQTSYCQGSFQI